ncbi:MAG TPA: hypothetical protein DCS07_02205 [Bdellovibrionales bacterium]|nr:MAG: hypothetical protein A2Z97_05235 [Bdellovibrionales bacterium GWB1_52_6]OFZ04593.1 MAG: hypothetical protein A2X97_13310 [Bdellovibrionales bacterium GWA1_52_35]HAR41438.1 hypothetical protein [Bdellovibrionales bacterium]HCM40005.1 hypothetical protein [Bdellovibrionales bacterium]
MTGSQKLFESKLEIINIGLPDFTLPFQQHETKFVQVDFRPGLQANAGACAKALLQTSLTENANQEVMEKILAARPAWTGMGIARDLIPGMRENTILHAGPPISWDRMCGPMRGGIIGAIIYEGKANTPDEAEELAAGGVFEFRPCHEHNAVGPMAGIVSPSMPVFVVKNETHGNVAYATQNEGLGKVLRYGAYSDEVIARLKWMEQTLYPTLKGAIEKAGRIDLKNIIAQALHMGDEVHNRNRAATSLFYRALAPWVVETAKSREVAVEVLNFINGNDHFFLNLSMAASKATLQAAQGIENSSIVVTMARNGTDFGVQLAGTGGRWFTGPAPVPDALFFKGYTKDDANPDIGDSAITETAGLGGFAIAASPAIVQFVGGQAADAVNYTLQMYEITAAENNVYQIPGLDFRGTPTGIDVRKVIEKNILPFIDTGVAHKNPGIGQVGAGVLSAPAEPFVRAFEGLFG